MDRTYLDWIRCQTWHLRQAVREDGGRGGMSDEVSWIAVIVGAAIAAAAALGAAVLAKVNGISF
jgi:hypothetical protein